MRSGLADARTKVQALEGRLLAMGAGELPPLDRGALERRVADWRGILRRGPVLARQILRKCFPGVRPLELSPVTGGVAFAGYALGASLLAGLANVSMMVPPG